MSSQLSSILTQTIGTFSISAILSAALTLLICLVVVRVLLKLTKKLLSGSKLDQRVQKYILSGIRLLLYIVTALIVADCLHINMTSLVALLSVGSLGITLAAEDILGNVAGGLVILSSHPFAIGDFVEVSGTSGTVDEISLNHTKLVTPDGLMVMLPNKELASSRMTNYTVLGRRRVTRKITASYDAPTETVKAACRQALEATENVLGDPAPSIYLTEYGSSSIEYTVYCWATVEHYWQVHFDLNEHLRTAFAQNNVEMTYDHLNVHLVEKHS
ncbi:MAG: mechanosensitive ion channel family protein [Dysosmobacter sp.]